MSEKNNFIYVMSNQSHKHVGDNLARLFVNPKAWHVPRYSIIPAADLMGTVTGRVGTSLCASCLSSTYSR